MFSKTITNSSKFLMMPNSAQNLYFHLGMNADDDGFCEHFTIMRMTDSKPDDLKILHSKNFVKIFDEKVLIILDWKENNYIRADRYSTSKYLELYKEELKQISGIPNDNQMGDDLATTGIPDDNQMVDNRYTQVRLDKVRLDKDSILCNIFEFWNNQKHLKKHSETAINHNVKKNHIDIIKKIGIEGVKKAITNYDTILSSDEYFFNFKWSLWEFIGRKNGIWNFLDEAKPLDNYKIKGFKKEFKPNIPKED